LGKFSLASKYYDLAIGKEKHNKGCKFVSTIYKRHITMLMKIPGNKKCEYLIKTALRKYPKDKELIKLSKKFEKYNK